MAKPVLRRVRVLLVVVEALSWTCALFGLWLLTLSAVDVGDLVVASAVALCGAAVAVVARRATGAAFATSRRLLRATALVPLAVLIDSGKVLSAPWRRGGLTGRFERVDAGLRGDEPRAAGRRALATTIVSVSPGTYALDAEPRHGRLLVHCLTSGKLSLEHEVAP